MNGFSLLSISIPIRSHRRVEECSDGEEAEAPCERFVEECSFREEEVCEGGEPEEEEEDVHCEMRTVPRQEEKGSFRHVLY